MKQFVDADTRIPETPQIAYVDGYSVGDRLLEGVLFEVRLNDSGEFVCDGVRAEDREYYNDFSAKRQVEWQEDIVRLVERYPDQLVSEDGRDIEVADEEGHTVAPRTAPRISVTVPVHKIDDVLVQIVAQTKHAEDVLKKEFSDLVGLTVPQAEKRAQNRGIEAIRPTVVDGDPQIVTMDYDDRRLNVATEMSRVVDILGTG